MNTRSLTGTIFHASGAAWASAVVRFRLLRRFVSADGVAPPDRVSITCEWHYNIRQRCSFSITAANS